MTALLTLELASCSDPPDPPAAPSPTGSTAGWMEWRAPDAPVRGPVVVVADAPGGPLDRLVADPDVTTFFNDRFHPVFEARATDTGITFYDGCGCLLLGPVHPTRPSELLSLANSVVVLPEAGRCQGRPFVRSCPGGEKTGAE